MKKVKVEALVVAVIFVVVMLVGLYTTKALSHDTMCDGITIVDYRNELGEAWIKVSYLIHVGDMGLHARTTSEWMPLEGFKEMCIK